MNESTKKQLEIDEVASLLRSVIQRVAVGPDRGRDITRLEAKQVMDAILRDEVDPVQVAVFFIALRMKRESLDEFSGLFDSMQSNITQITVNVPELTCLADPFDGYVRHLTMTPFLPATLAACGMPALIHGVNSVGPKHGITSSKVYQLANINTKLTQADAAEVIAQRGWSYLDQSVYAPKLYGLNELRDTIVKRTALTTLERLLMPLCGINETHLVLGYVHKAYPHIYAGIASQAGYQSSLLLKGVEGGLAPALNKPLRQYYFNSNELAEMDFSDHALVDQYKEVRDIGDEISADVAAQTVGDVVINKLAEECLELGLDVLSGHHNVARKSLCLAAGQILFAHKRVQSMGEAVAKVSECLDNGHAKELFL